ncbi:hypothetical protein M5K25_010789 [Dendrobium thyrsiflorum]|uniref:Uncharacterized protein n=1 Tax=Dendrobium thyrsiflorum TaxID=117978 RepID=A0ABD0V260_DENTH
MGIRAYSRQIKGQRPSGTLQCLRVVLLCIGRLPELILGGKGVMSLLSDMMAQCIEIYRSLILTGVTLGVELHMMFQSSPILEPDTLHTPPGFPFPVFLPNQCTILSQSLGLNAELEFTLDILGVESRLAIDYTSNDAEDDLSPGFTSHLGNHCLTDLSDETYHSGSKLAYFMSKVPSQDRRYFGRQLMSRARHIVTALRHPLLGVDLDDLPFPDLASFCLGASLLLDYAASSGLRDAALETWEYHCRVVTFGLYRLHFVSGELAFGVPDGLEDGVRAAWDRMRRARMNLDFGLQTLRRCQRDISEEQLELLEISVNLKALRQRERALLERQRELRAAAAYTEEDFSWIAIEVERLEQDLSLSTEEFDFQ